MTKKDYIAVAKILASHRNNIPTDHFNDLVADFCAMFKANNKRFDDLRFCNACKPLSWPEQEQLIRNRTASYLGMPVTIKGK